jgi:hypothetical protein
MLFGFRGIRLFQLLLVLAALAAGIGATVLVKAYTGDAGLPALFGAFGLGLVFLWAFATALRAPTSFVAVAGERTRIRFAGFIDTVIPNSDVLSVTVQHRSLLYGIGVRTDFRGEVGLISIPGEVAVLALREPVRVWLIPRLIRLRARRLAVSVRHPERLAEALGGQNAGTGKAAASPRRRPARRMKR